MKVAEEKLDQETVAQANERLARMNLGAGAMQGIGPAALARTTEAALQKSARAPRKDKGTRRVKAAEPPAQASTGVLTDEQWEHLSMLVERVTQTAVDLRDASERLSRAEDEYRDYLDSLRQQ